MSTTLEKYPGGDEVDPAESIASFIDVNAQLIEVAVHAVERPSTGAILVLDQLKRGAVESMKPMIGTQFFRASGEETLVNAAAGAVMKATEHLWMTATKLRPDDPTNYNFDADVQGRVVGALTNASDDSEEGRLAISQAMNVLCNTHQGAVENLYEKVITSDSVMLHALRIQEKIERKKRLINFGSTALAVFAGTVLANRISNKKN